MSELSSEATQLVRSLLRLHGHDPAGFHASLDGLSVCVRGPVAFACYRADGWTSRFIRHLCSGYYDPRPQRHPTADMEQAAG
jgi:hypothetical protein